MSSLRLAVVVATTCVLAPSFAGLAARAAGGDAGQGERPSTAAAVQVSPHTHSDHFYGLNPVVGSPSALVYSRAPHLFASYQASAAGGPLSRLMVTRRDGKPPLDLGHYRQRSAYWSIVGHTLTAVGNEGDDEIMQTNRVDYWNTRTAVHGHLMLGPPALEPEKLYLSAAPGAITYTTEARHELYLRRLRGGIVDLGAPLGPAATIVGAVAGPTGLVIFGRGATVTSGLVFMPYADLGMFTPLDTGTTDAPTCTAASAAYVACATGDSDILVSIGGAAPTPSTVCPSDEPQLAGDTIVWVNVCDSQPPAIEQLAARSVQPTDTGLRAYDLLVSAFGDAVFDRPVGDDTPITRLRGLTGSGTTETLDHEEAPIAVGGFALARGSVLFSQDAGNGVIESRALKRRGRRLDVGPRSVVARATATTAVAPTVLSAARRTRVYALRPRRDPGRIRSIEVRRRGVTTTIAHSGSLTDGNEFELVESAQLAGRRLLIERRDGDIVKSTLVNLRNGHRRVVAAETNGNLADVALTRDRLAYVTGSGSRSVIRSRDLSTGRTRIVATVPASATEISVLAHGPWVAWAVRPFTGRVYSGLRDVARMSPPISIDRRLVLDLSGRDVVLVNHRPLDGGILRPTATEVRSYNGRVRRVLPPQAFVIGPQLVGHTLAWVAADGALRTMLIR